MFEVNCDIRRRNQTFSWKFIDFNYSIEKAIRVAVVVIGESKLLRSF